MPTFVIRFFVDGKAVDDMVEADNLAGAVGEAHNKLTQPSFPTRDINGTLGMTLRPDQVSHVTVVSTPPKETLTAANKRILGVTRDVPKPRERKRF